jgi:hypothetical protein
MSRPAADFTSTDQRSVDELDAAISHLVRQMNADSYRMLVLVREFDDRLGWKKWTYKNCAEWLSWRAGISLATAREKVRMAHALRKLPAIAAAFAEGRLSYSKVRALTRVAHRQDENMLLKHALVADAGGNDLLRINRHGSIHVLAIFPDEIVSTANIKELAACPSPAPFCALPDAIPAQPVPTSIAIGRDGYIYVGELKGFPAPTGESNIWRVSPRANWAQCGASPDCVKVFDGGFTSIIDLAVGRDGKLYVAEFDESSWAAVEIFGTPTGGTVSACDLRRKTCQVVANNIPELTAITFGKDGSLWGTQNSLVAGEGQVVKLRRGSYGRFLGHWFHKPDFSLFRH